MQEASEELKTVEIQDELGEDITQISKDSLKQEVQQFQERLVQLDKDYENYKKQSDIDKELFDIQLTGDNFKLVTPTYKYQTNERYWELVKQKLEYKFRQDRAQAEGYLKGNRAQYDATKEQLESSKKALDAINK